MFAPRPANHTLSTIQNPRDTDCICNAAAGKSIAERRVFRAVTRVLSFAQTLQTSAHNLF
jgi:hypothetical protein